MKHRWAILVVTLAAGSAACGDAETSDGRGYTKAPLERPGLRIQPQPVNEMDRLGQPVRPTGDTIAMPADTSAGA